MCCSAADINQRTYVQFQTPIHLAARTNSLKALRVLIKHGGDYEARDYKGRTPLHLAAKFDQSLSAEYLLRLDKPARCQVVDHKGNTALVSMIRTMPKTAVNALRQFHTIVPADRKQYFMLSPLEPLPGEKTPGIKTPVSCE